MEGIGEGRADLDLGAGRDRVVNVEELLTYLRGRVPQLTGNRQTPTCPLLTDFGEPFPHCARAVTRRLIRVRPETVTALRSVLQQEGRTFELQHGIFIRCGWRRCEALRRT
ncbi:MAG TPA: hypothetical protein VK689_05035 [Armatimonadota bacterium]|nr:hypothetical protein [Armatimonadota bacterium]